MKLSDYASRVSNDKKLQKHAKRSVKHFSGALSRVKSAADVLLDPKVDEEVTKAVREFSLARERLTRKEKHWKRRLLLLSVVVYALWRIKQRPVERF